MTGTLAAKLSIPIDTNQLCTIGTSSGVARIIRRRSVKWRTNRGSTNELAARTPSVNTFAAATKPIERPATSVQRNRNEFGFRKPVGTNSGYFSGCARIDTAARCPGRSW